MFVKVRHQVTTFNNSDEGLEPPQFFHYVRSAYRMMKEMGYDLCRGEGLNFRKGQCIPLQPFALKGKPANYYDQTRKALGYIPHPLKLIRHPKSLYHHIPQTHRTENLM